MASTFFDTQSLSSSAEFHSIGRNHPDKSDAVSNSLIPQYVHVIQGLSPYRTISQQRNNSLPQGSARTDLGHAPPALDQRSRSIEMRQAEFRVGRKLALMALKQAGYVGGVAEPLESHRLADAIAPTVEPIGRRPDRTPIWPEGFVGSISHSQRWVWAAVAREQQVRSLGIDTEIIAAADQAASLKDEIGTPLEIQILRQLGFSQTIAVTLLFSAKESLYKCCYPLTGEFWEFKDVALISASVDPQKTVQREKLLSGSLLFEIKPNCPSSIIQLKDRFPVRFQISTPDLYTFAYLLP